MRPPVLISVERGQALALALVLLAGAAAALVQMFDAGRLVHRKARLANAIDAAAYSGAVVQARALNFLAYANRAVVAHQVAMAHLVTLASWARFGDTQARQLAASNPPATLIGGLFGARHGAAYAGSGTARGAGADAAWPDGGLARAFAGHDAVVHDVLARAQAAVQAGLAGSRDAAVRAILAANHDGDPAVLDLRWLDDDLPGFIARQSGGARARLKSVVETAADRYGFLAPRDHTASSPLPIDRRCPLLRHQLRRRGSTGMAGLDAWRSLDTQSYHALRSNRWIGCYYREYPMGRGAVLPGNGGVDADTPYVDDPPDDFADQDFWRWVQQATRWDLLDEAANPLANSLAVAQRDVWRGRGLPAFPELSADALRMGGTARLRFAVVARRDGGASGASPVTGYRVSGASAVSPRASPAPFTAVAAGSLRFGEAPALAAVAAAETYYQRPGPRADGRRELPSLFQPYWHARLGAATDDERRRALALLEAP
ncbi:hypothetical protein GCM10023144_30740 [Pigmentiphaga soli]|uniref:Flp pilus-assembly TadG-like N-terminal domain-containing protein n=1 Tax=Pigmentiphaga soli TaxID=1007095 RepID=A0ABP8HAY3_9BURK